MDVKKVSYHSMYEFVLDAKTKTEFVDKIQMCSLIIIEELNSRLESKIFPIQMSIEIEKMDEEVTEFVNRINESFIIIDQPKVEEKMFTRLLFAFNFRCHENYSFYSKVLPN